jgi:hypothetical protein
VRAAALRALARLHEPAAARLLSGRTWTLDAAEEDHATAWVALAEALAPLGDAEGRRGMRTALEAVATQRAADGDAAGAARARALAARVAALGDPARAPGEADVPRLREALAAGSADERAAAAAALARAGSEAARAAIAERIPLETDPFVLHQLRRRLAGAAGGDAPSDPGPAAAHALWAGRQEEAEAADPADAPRLLAALEEEARAAVARWAPGVRDLPAADRLGVARFAEAARDGAALRRAVAALLEEGGEPGREATTWAAALALEDHDPARALVHLRRLERDFGGRGRDPRGRAVSAETLAGAIVEEAAAVARAAVEGASPDPTAAERALAAGGEALESAREDEEAADRLAAARAWVALDAAALSAVVPAGAGPRAVALADHYQLVEPVLPSVLRRWARGIDVEVVGVLEGKVRRGVRRFDATAAEERAAVKEAAQAFGARVTRFAGRGGDVARPAWLADVPAALFLLDAEGRLVGRASGAALDPRTLEPVVEALSRDPAATRPPR